MKIGTDISLKVCMAEGYLIMDFKKRELFKDGKIQKDAPVRFYKHYPEHIREEMGWKVGDRLIMDDAELTLEDVWESYTDNKDSIDSYAGISHDSIDTIQSEYDFLHLVSDVDGYNGIVSDNSIYS